MRKQLFAAALSIAITTSPSDFTRVVQTYVTSNDGTIQKSVRIDIDNRTFFTDERGIAYLDVKPGNYTVRVAKDSCEQAEYEVTIKESMAVLQLKVYCPK